MLQIEQIIAKMGADTVENGPQFPKFDKTLANIWILEICQMVAFVKPARCTFPNVYRAAQYKTKKQRKKSNTYPNK